MLRIVLVLGWLTAHETVTAAAFRDKKCVVGGVRTINCPHKSRGLDSDDIPVMKVVMLPQ
jgi:hypothetical protein